MSPTERRHAMVGDPWADLSRLHEELLSGRPWIANPFWEAYDPGVGDAERAARLAAYNVLRHLRGIRFAHVTNDALFLAETVERISEDCA